MKSHLSRQLSAAVAVVALILLSGCANNFKDRAADASVAYGFIDMEDAPTDLDWLTIQQVKPKTKEPYWHAGVQKVEKGYLFYHYGLPPGTYQVTEFGGQNSFLIFSGTPHTYSFGRQGRNESAIEIKKPGVHFIGAFRFKRYKNGFFKAETFDIEAVKEHPPHKAMIEELLLDAPEHPGIQAQLKTAAEKAK